MVLLSLPTPKESRVKHPISLDKVSQTLSEWSHGELTDFFNHIKRSKNFKPKKVTQYLARKPEKWSIMFWFLPYSTHLELYIKKHFGDSYYNQKLVDDILEVNQISLTVSLLNENLKSHPFLVNLTNCYNSRFSFKDEYFQKRFLEFQEFWPDMDWKDLILGSGLTLFLASQKPISKTDCPFEFKIYSKKQKRCLGKHPVYFQKDTNHQIHYNSDSKTILLHYPHVVDNLFEVLIENQEDLACDLSQEEYKIVTLAQTYQKEKFFQFSEFKESNFNPDAFSKYQLRKILVYLSTQTKVLERHLMNQINAVHLKISNSKHPKCYICNQHFNPYLVPKRYIHHCFKCGLLEYEKRITKVDLNSIKVYVSGCRIKIGYSTTLRFLRLGANVIGSTRFPKLALMNFQKEEDYDQWKDRLTILKADFKSLKEVEILVQYLKKEKFNILINNACQTIRPSQEYLKTLGQAESNLSLEYISSDLKDKELALRESSSEILKGSEIIPFSTSSSLSLNRYHDIDDHQGRNSTWYKEIDQIDPSEIIEVTAVNQLVPTLLINQLRPSMSDPAFIINVTAIEGQFNTSSKDAFHPHTNMAKAAINMMIRTLAEEKDPRVLPYAVDPGFVSGVRERTMVTGITPIQSDDGASRVVDPVISYFLNNKLKPGKYRHYELEDW